MSDNKNKTKQTHIKIDEVQYYFDAQQQDYIDRGMVGIKSSQILDLRDRLMSLPAQEFDAAMKTLRTFVLSPDHKKNKEEDNQKRKDAMQLFSQVNRSAESSTASSPKVSAV